MENSANINDIISSLSSDDIEMLKGVAASILGNDESAENNNSTMQAHNKNSLGADSVDFNMLMKAKTIFERMNSTPNKNADLIMALKPHLSPETQNKADEAMRILRLFEILPLLKELF